MAGLRRVFTVFELIIQWVASLKLTMNSHLEAPRNQSKCLNGVADVAERFQKLAIQDAEYSSKRQKGDQEDGRVEYNGRGRLLCQT